MSEYVAISPDAFGTEIPEAHGPFSTLDQAHEWAGNRWPGETYSVFELRAPIDEVHHTGKHEMEAEAEEQAALREVIGDARKRRAYEIIHARGGVRAEAEFSGSGDSGFVEGVAIINAEGVTVGTDRELDSIADDLVCGEWSGWYDGEGGCGTVEFTEDGEFKAAMNWYVETTEPAGEVTI